jgi:hypothetical protein
MRLKGMMARQRRVLGARGYLLAFGLIAACATTRSDGPGAVSPPPGRNIPSAPTEATPAWQRRIQAEVSALRGLPFKGPVGYGVQSRTSFRAFVRAELDREMPSAKMSALSRSYARMGFLATGFNLRTALEEALTTQVAAYYDPRQKALRVVDGQRSAAEGPQRDDEVVAHELEHALQDQHFDLQAFDPEDSTLDEDEQMARKFVAEGEAMFVMLAWQMGSGAGAARRLGPMAVAGLRMSVAMLAAGDIVDMLAGMRQGGGAALPAEARAEIEALVRLPPVIVSPLVDPYLKGALMVSEAWARGGWPAVDDLFRHPPTSTEQALHPVEKLLDRRDPPIRMTAPARRPAGLAAATPLASEVLGELGWRIYFKTTAQPAGEQAAAGWGGDRFWSFEVKGRPVVLTATRWDTAADARQFFDAYGASLRQRFPSAPIEVQGDLIRAERPGGGVITVRLAGLDVDIADAAVADLPASTAFLREVQRR